MARPRKYQDPHKCLTTQEKAKLCLLKKLNVTQQGAMDAGVNGIIMLAIHAGQLDKEDVEIYRQLTGWELTKVIEQLPDLTVQLPLSLVSQPAVHVEVPVEPEPPKQNDFDAMSTAFNEMAGPSFSDNEIKNLYYDHGELRRLETGAFRQGMLAMYNRILDKCPPTEIVFPERDDYVGAELARYFVLESYGVRFLNGGEEEDDE